MPCFLWKGWVEIWTVEWSFLNFKLQSASIVFLSDFVFSCLISRCAYTGLNGCANLRLSKGSIYVEFHPLLTRDIPFLYPLSFMVSLSPSTQSNTTGEDQDRSMADVIIWDVRKCVSRREFTIPVESYPAFKWSYSDAYFACLREGYVVIYETETFRLLDKKRLGGGNIRDFSWSPTENVLAYWVPESDNTPAR